MAKASQTSRKSLVQTRKTPLVAAGLVTLGAVTIFAYRSLFSSTAYEVVRVIDGDTFETKEKQIVRIDGIQAPEPEKCGAEGARDMLSSYVLGKRVFIKTVYLDRYRRMIAKVYLPDGSLLASRLASDGVVYVIQKSGSDPDLLSAGNSARAKAKGIFSETCTQTINPDDPSCAIKGNRADRTDRAIYQTPDCPHYGSVLVQTYMDDRWFCTENEAREAGFTKAKDCP